MGLLACLNTWGTLLPRAFGLHSGLSALPHFVQISAQMSSYRENPPSATFYLLISTLPSHSQLSFVFSYLLVCFLSSMEDELQEGKGFVLRTAVSLVLWILLSTLPALSKHFLNEYIHKLNEWMTVCYGIIVWLRLSGQLIWAFLNISSRYILVVI